jgi:hypothetical protein
VTAEISVHDNVLLSYTVQGAEREIRLQTIFRDREPHELTEVVFSDVVAYHFEADNFNTILFDIAEVGVEQVVAAHQELFARQKNFGWPDFAYNTEPELLEKLREQGIKGFVISSSYGMDGFVMAKQMRWIPADGEAW